MGTESLLLSKLKKSIKKKKTGQIIILFRLIKGVKDEDVPRASRTLFLNKIERENFIGKYLDSIPNNRRGERYMSEE